MQPEELTLTADDGAALAVYRWQPTAASPRGAVQIAHGMAEHAARYAPLAEALVAEGYLVHAHDHRGHGKTASSDHELGWFGAHEGWARAVADVHALNRFVATCRVLGSDEQDSRLALVEATCRVLGKGLDLLGIEALDRM